MLIGRRWLIRASAGLPLLGIPLIGRALAMSAVDKLRGKETLSEAVQLGGLSEDGQTGIRLRLCRYPDAGEAWAWITLFTPAGVFNFCDNHLPCPPEHTDLKADSARYSAKSDAPMLFERSGPRTVPTAMVATIDAMTHRGGAYVPGPGRVPLRLRAAFTPTRGHAGLLDERTETAGTVLLSGTIGRQRIAARLRGQMHEQPQTKPRFVDPFSYGSLWGDDISLTYALTPKGSVGYIIGADGKTRLANKVELSPPGPERLLRLSFPDGSSEAFPCRRTHTYEVPIYDGVKPGSMVICDRGGKRLTGGLNDWMPQGVPYLTADIARQRLARR